MKIGRNYLIIILVVILIFLENFGIDNQYIESFYKFSRSATPVEMALSSLGGFRKFVAGMLWIKIDEYHHEFIASGGDQNTQTDYMPIIRIITWLDPNFVDAYIVGGWQLYSNIGKTNEGMKFLLEGFEKNKDSYYLAREIATQYKFGEKNYKEAIKYCLIALENLPSKIKKNEEIDKALEGEFKYVSSDIADVQYAFIYELLGSSYDSLGNYDKAKEYYKKAVDLRGKKAKKFIERLKELENMSKKGVGNEKK